MWLYIAWERFNWKVPASGESASSQYTFLVERDVGDQITGELGKADN